MIETRSAVQPIPPRGAFSPGGERYPTRTRIASLRILPPNRRSATCPPPARAPPSGCASHPTFRVCVLRNGAARSPRPSNSGSLTTLPDRSRPQFSIYKSSHLQPSNFPPHSVPVEPNPPGPRTVSSNASRRTHSTRACWATTSCAMRMPRSTVNGSRPWFTSSTFTSPR